MLCLLTFVSGNKYKSVLCIRITGMKRCMSQRNKRNSGLTRLFHKISLKIPVVFAKLDSAHAHAVE